MEKVNKGIGSQRECTYMYLYKGLSDHIAFLLSDYIGRDGGEVALVWKDLRGIAHLSLL